MSGGPSTGLLLLHGFTGGPESWDRVRQALPRDLRVAAPALLGHGPGGGDVSAEDFDAEVDRLAQFGRGTLGSPFALGGYSLGGRLALRLAVRHPGAVSRLTLVGARAGLAGPEARAARIAEDEVWAQRALREGAERFATAWEARPLFARAEAALAPKVRAERQALRRSHTPEGLARALRVLGLGRMPNLGPALPSLNVPTTLVVGAEDTKFRALAEEMARALPRVRLVAVPGAGHDVVLAAPARVAALLSAEDAP